MAMSPSESAIPAPIGVGSKNSIRVFTGLLPSKPSKLQKNKDKGVDWDCQPSHVGEVAASASSSVVKCRFNAPRMFFPPQSPLALFKLRPLTGCGTVVGPPAFDRGGLKPACTNPTHGIGRVRPLEELHGAGSTHLRYDHGASIHPRAR